MLRRLREGRVAWLVLGVALEACSLFGEVALFRGVFARPGNRIGWRSSAEITLAGAAATKVVAAAGAGGVAVTVWGLRAYGLSGAAVADGMVLLRDRHVWDLRCRSGDRGVRPLVWGVRWSRPRWPDPSPRHLLRRCHRHRPIDGHRRRACSNVSRATGGRLEWPRERVVAPRRRGTALAPHGTAGRAGYARRRDPSLLGTLAYWGFDIGTPWASLRAFGHSPPGAVLVTGYYAGTAGNVLPVPGGIGGVEAGMIGAFVGLRVRSSLATLAVLGYRTISYWLPTVPGAIAYVRLRHAAGARNSEAQ